MSTDTIDIDRSVGDFSYPEQHTFDAGEERKRALRLGAHKQRLILLKIRAKENNPIILYEHLISAISRVGDDRRCVLCRQIHGLSR